MIEKMIIKVFNNSKFINAVDNKVFRENIVFPSF